MKNQRKSFLYTFMRGGDKKCLNYEIFSDANVCFVPREGVFTHSKRERKKKVLFVFEIGKLGNACESDIKA